MQIYMMTWSPNGEQLAFMGKEAGRRWKIYTVSLEGAGATMLLSEDRSEADPSWSPDGHSIAFGRPTAYMTEEAVDKTISIVNVQTGKVTELPGSKGFFSPRWSPNGQYLAAISLDQRKLMICNLATKQWSEISTISIDNPVWSADSRSIYYHSFMEPDLPIYKLDLQSRKQEKIFRLGDIQISDASDYSFQGIATDGSPILAVNLWSADVYQIAWKGR
jgi:Tol biopolymer transport system component